MAVTAAGRLNVPPPLLTEVRSDNQVVSLTLHAAVNSEGRDSFAYNGKSIAPVIRVFPGDTVNVPVGETVDVVMDFTNPVIKGMSLFHCHLLNHEDKGMMAKILFE